MRQLQERGTGLGAVDWPGPDPAPAIVPAASLICVVGVPGPLADWCATLLGALAGGENGPAPTFTVQSLADLGRRLLKPFPIPAIALVRYPDPALCDALLADGGPFLLLTAPPHETIEAIAVDRGISIAEAARQVANAQSATARLATAPGALVIAADTAGDPAALAMTIAAHFGLPRPRIAPPLPLAPTASAAADDASPDVRALIEDTLAGEEARPLTARALADAALPPAGGRIVWPRDLLSTGSPGVPATGAIDLTGPARCVVFGPYIRLPAGPWSCALLFGCSPEAAGLAMAADVYAGRHLGQVSFTIGEAGIFEVEIPFENTDSDQPVEVRLFTSRAAFEGRVAIGQVTLTPLAAKRLKVS